MNLYTVEFDLVSPSATREEYEVLPTHIIASNQSNAVETALNFSTINFQLKRVFLNTEKVNIVKETI
jgi:hypothetical protein